MNTNKILISIIIPLYNCEKFILKTLISCKNQNDSQTEIIVIDDCSTDGSFSIVEQYVVDEKSDSITLYKNDENLGMMKTVNFGISRAKGEYLIVLGCDDVLPEGYIFAIRKYLRNDVAIVFSMPHLIDEYDRNFGVYSSYNFKMMHEDEIRRFLGKENIIPSVGLISNARMMKDIGGYYAEERNYGEWMTWIKMANKGHIVFCDTVHALYRRHSSNITNSFANKDKKIELERYWRRCRLFACLHLRCSFISRLSILWYFIKSSVKTLL